MMWNAALVINYNLPIPGREGKAMEVFADALLSSANSPQMANVPNLRCSITSSEAA